MQLTTVPPDYRNVICPWQTPREIKAQSRFLDRMFKTLPPERRRELLRLDQPNRSWVPRPGRWMRATARTHWGVFEVRIRPDGAYDLRQVDGHYDIIGGPHAILGVSASRIEAEFSIERDPRYRPKR